MREARSRVYQGVFLRCHLRNPLVYLHRAEKNKKNTRNFPSVLYRGDLDIIGAYVIKFDRLRGQHVYAPVCGCRT